MYADADADAAAELTENCFVVDWSRPVAGAAAGGSGTAVARVRRCGSDWDFVVTGKTPQTKSDDPWRRWRYKGCRSRRGLDQFVCLKAFLTIGLQTRLQRAKRTADGGLPETPWEVDSLARAREATDLNTNRLNQTRRRERQMGSGG